MPQTTKHNLQLLIQAGLEEQLCESLTLNGPALLTPYEQLSRRVDELKKKIISEYQDVRVAVLEKNELLPKDEAILKELGADMIIIRNPSKRDRALFRPENGYHCKSTKVSWSTQVASTENYLGGLSAKHRRRILSKLRKSSNSVVTEIETLDKKNFAEWYKIYDQEVAGRARGRRVIDSNWAERQADLSHYQALSLIDNESGKLLGGSVLGLHPSSLTVEIAYSAFLSEHRDKELSLRAFSETLDFSNQNSYRRLRHGRDRNLFGYYLSPGLMEYKASLDFKPLLSKNLEIIKVLRPERLGAELAFFSNTSEGLKYKLFQTKPRKFSLPSDTSLETIDISNSTTPLLTVVDNFDVITLCDWENKGKELLSLIDSPKHTEEVSRLKNFRASSQAVGACDLINRGLLTAEELLEHAKKHQLTRVPGSDTEFSEQWLTTLKGTDITHRLAGFLDQWSYGINIDVIGSLCLDKCFGSIELIEKTPNHYHSALNWQHLLDQICTNYGEAGLEKFIRSLHQVDSLAGFFNNPYSYECFPCNQDPLHFSLSDIDLNEFFLAEDIAEASVLIKKIYQFLLRVHDPIGAVGYSQPYITSTIGGKNVGIIKDFLCFPDEMLESFIKAVNPESFENEESYIVVLCKLHQLRKNKASPQPERFRLRTLQTAEEHLVKILYVSCFNAADVRTLLLCSGIDPQSISCQGRTSEEIAHELVTRASSKQLFTLIHTAAQLHSYDSRICRSFDIIKNSFDFDTHTRSAAPLQQIFKPSTKLLDTLKVLQDLDELIETHNTFLEFFYEKLDLDYTDLKITMRFRCINTLINQYFEKYQSLPDISIEQAVNWLEEYTIQGGNPARAVTFMALNPEVDFSPEVTRRILANFDKFERCRGTYNWTDLVFLLKAYQQDAFRAASLKALQAIDQLHYHEGSIDKVDGDFQLFKQAVATVDIKNEHKRILEAELRAILYRSTDNHDEQHATTINTLKSIVCVYHALNFLGLDTDQIIEALEKQPSPDSIQVLQAINMLMEVNRKERKQSTTQMLSRIYHKIIANLDDQSTWYVCVPPLSLGLAAIRFDPKACSRVSKPLMKWMVFKASWGSYTDQELSEFFHWTLEQAKTIGQLSETDLGLTYIITKIKDPDLFKQCKNKFQSTLNSVAWPHQGFYPVMMEEVSETEHEQLAWQDLIICTKEMLAQHPWTAYGYSDQDQQKIRAIAKDPNLTDFQAEQIGAFLFSIQEHPFSLLWLQGILHGVSDRGASNLCRFLNFYLSLPPSTRTTYFVQRIDRLLGERILALSKRVEGPVYKQLAERLNQTENTEAIPSVLLKKIYKLKICKMLLQEYSQAEEPEWRETLFKPIIAQFTENNIVHLNAEQEMQALISYQSASFKDRLALPDHEEKQVLDFIQQNMKLLNQTDIQNRLVQFSSFANQDGIQRLSQVLKSYSDPNQSRIELVERPDLGSQQTTHFNYFGKFTRLTEQMLERGMPRAKVEEFISKWMQLWHFLAVDADTKQWLTFTHDLERWCKHSETPSITCQKIYADSGKLRVDNPNYKFGVFSNRDGKPLARILLGQLKVADLTVDGKHKIRSVIEVTVTQDNNPRPALLVEKVFPSKFNVENPVFYAAIKKMAREEFGIPEEDVYFSDQQRKYPMPLEEDFLILRDTYRHSIAPPTKQSET